MNSEPCAKLTMRVTPKISVRPAATRNSDDADARPLRNWSAKEAKVTKGGMRIEDKGSRGRQRRTIRRAYPTLLSIDYRRLEAAAAMQPLS